MRAPDLNAPRFRYDFRDILRNEFIIKFKEKYPQYAQYDSELLIKAIKKHNQSIWRAVIDNREGVALQSEIGNIFIGMTPAQTKRKNICYDKSVKLGIPVYHKNYETDGKVAKIFYSNYGSQYKLENRQLWWFTGVRQFKRTIAAECAKNWRKYVSIDSSYKVWDLFERRIHKGRVTANAKAGIESYNEFE